ncbi:MAG: GNAT family N-acetyltransferase [Anaerolineaceae bacterium]|nr:GNAT family N-acetyltransferase [Anaerolineaceae bacterium]
MDKAAIIALYDQDQRINVTYPDLRRDVLPRLIRHVDKTNKMEGSIIYSQLTAETVDAAIKEQVAYFNNIDQPFEWKVFDYDQPPDLKERLAQHGFVVEEQEAIMVMPLAAAGDVFWQPITHDIRKITDAGGLDDVQCIEQVVWNEDASWVQDYLGLTLREQPEQMSVYVAYIDGKPASAAWIYYPEGSQFASLWGGSTIAEYRKRGLYTALLAIRAQEAKTRGVAYLTVDASPMSQPILTKYGFELLAYSWPCKWEIEE